MSSIVKSFNELSTKELYEILKLRSAVFVVEQNCVYQDLDGKDEDALHVLQKKEGDIVAYARIFKPGDNLGDASIGRVVVEKKYRKYGYGKEIMHTAIRTIEERFRASSILLSAQTYLIKFYMDLGFCSVGEEYLEDGISHIRMVRK